MGIFVRLFMQRDLVQDVASDHNTKFSVRNEEICLVELFLMLLQCFLKLELQKVNVTIGLC